jgi:hypothetical protein
MLSQSTKVLLNGFKAGRVPLLRSQSAHPKPRYLRKTPLIARSDGVILRYCGGADHQVAFPHPNAVPGQISAQRSVYPRDDEIEGETGSCAIRPSTKAWCR